MSETPIAIVIGGSRGIGRAVAVRLARSGFNLVVTARANRVAADETRALVEAEGRTCNVLLFDIADRDDV